MKKRIFGAALLVAIVVAAGWNYQQNINEVEFSDLALDNVEALASGESGRGCTYDRNAICETSCNDYKDYRNN